MNNEIIALDIGGTNIKYGKITTSGELISTGNISTEAEKGVNSLLSKIYIIVEEYLSKKTLGIAISATGQIDFNLGKVVGGNPIIDGWIGCELVKILEEKYKLPCILENDVNCAALGEMWFGEGKEESNFLCLTIGTGIGGGIILNRNLFRGASSVAGEFGKLFLENKTGTYERYSSMSALLRITNEKLNKNLDGKEIFNLYWSNDKEIQVIVDEWIDNITSGLRTLLYIWNPSCIIIGGAVTHQGDKLKKLIEESLEKKITENYLKCLRIKFAKLGNNAGLLGATYLLLTKIDRLNK